MGIKKFLFKHFSAIFAYYSNIYRVTSLRTYSPASLF